MVAQLHKCAKKMKIFAGLGRPKTPMPSASPRRDHHFGTLTLTLTLSSSTAVGTAKGSVAASADANRDISCLHSVCSNDWRCVLAARAYASLIRPAGPNRTGWIQISDAIG